MIKKFLKEIVFFIIRISGIPLIVRKFHHSKGIVVFLFHNIDEDCFRQTYTWLSKKYNMITLDQCVQAIRSGHFDKLPRNPAVITFDDARRDNLNLLKFESYFRIRPFLFVSTHPSRLDGKTFCFAEEVKLLQGIFDIGGHTHTHPRLPFLGITQQFYEIREGKENLERLVGKKIRHFAYPYGLYSEETVKMVKSAGFESAFTVDLGVNFVGQDAYRIKRICLDEKMSINGLVVKSSGVWDYIFNRSSLTREVKK